MTGTEGKKFTVHKYSFSVRDQDRNVIGSQLQYPIKLGYATTVHKTQGRTIPELTIDCKTFWKPGQMGVAVGRFVSKSGLQVVNYKSYTAHLLYPQIVDDLYRSPGTQINYDNHRCCHKNEIQDVGNVHTHAFQLQGPHSVGMQNLQICEEKLEHLVARKFPYDMGKFLDEQMFKGITDIQRERNELIKCHHESEHFIKSIQDAYQYVRNLFDTFCIPPKNSKCKWYILCAKIQDHLTCTHYNAQCMKAFNTAELLPNMKAVCSKIYMDIPGKIAHDEVYIFTQM